MGTANIDDLLAEAAKLRQVGNLEQAAELYQSILRASPRDAVANYQMGTLAAQMNYAEAALSFLGVALDEAPTERLYWLSYIEALYRSGKAADSRETLALARTHGLEGDDVDAMELRLLASAQVPNEHSQLDQSLQRAAAVSAPSSQEVAALTQLFAERRLKELQQQAMDMLRRFPCHWSGWKALGVAYQHAGKNADAVLPMLKTVELLPHDAEAHNNLGIVQQGLGNLSEAEACYRRALQLLPTYAQAYGNLGTVLKERGCLTEAEHLCRRAIELEPAYVNAYRNLGVVLSEMRRYGEAESVYRRALEIQPNSADIHNNLGMLLNSLGHCEEAVRCYRQALKINPLFVEAHSNLAVTLFAEGEVIQAEETFRQVLKLDPNRIDTMKCLAHIEVYREQLPKAVELLEEAYTINPQDADIQISLATLYFRLGSSAKALDSCREAILQNPSSDSAYVGLGAILGKLGRLTEAEENLRLATEINPESATAFNLLGAILQEQMRLDEAAGAWKRALAVNGDHLPVLSNLLLLSNFTASRATEQDLELARQFGCKTSDLTKSKYTSWLCDKQPQRLRIGLVSGDFRNHPVGYFVEGLLTHLTETPIEFFAYRTDCYPADDLTERLKTQFIQWRSIDQLGDAAAARTIRSDGIHVLIDLSGHTAENRLSVFSWKSAPVQATWLGYFATTGVPEMDYVVGDPYVTPDNEAHHFSETIWRLPETYLCFSPPALQLETNSLPALMNGHITFGCFNKLSKMNDAVVSLWARVLAQVPGSLLLLKTKELADPMMRQLTRKRFSDLGIADDRIVMEGGSSRAVHLAAYHRVDVALDPFPYPGGTTSVEALWMGVPVLTRQGNRFLSHVGETVAHNTQMSDWVATDDDDYLAKAVRFGSDFNGLAILRARLRQQILSSPLCDASRFARHFSEAMWGMWNKFVSEEKK